MDWHEWRGETLVLNLHVQPRARAPGVDGLHGERLRVRLAAPPVDGKANEELRGFLAAAFGLPKRAVTIAHGDHGSTKSVELAAPKTLPAWFVALGGHTAPASPPTADARPGRRPRA